MIQPPLIIDPHTATIETMGNGFWVWRKRVLCWWWPPLPIIGEREASNLSLRERHWRESWVWTRHGVDQKERRKREKRREEMRVEREIPRLKRTSSINFFFYLYLFIPFSYSIILHLRWYYSYISKKFGLFQFGLPIAEQFLGLNAKCTLHLAYNKPTDALSHPLFLFGEEENFKAVHEVINVFCGRILN